MSFLTKWSASEHLLDEPHLLLIQAVHTKKADAFYFDALAVDVLALARPKSHDLTVAARLFRSWPVVQRPCDRTPVR